MDPTIATLVTAAATSTVTTLATKGAEAPAKTFSLLWKCTFGRWDSLLERKVKENMKKYADDIDEEVKKIPSENINQNMDIDIIGPALEASKYYVEKPEIRKMFAKLIAADLDITKTDKVHHSFVDIIRQMSSNDARLLKKLPKFGPLVEFRLYSKDERSYLNFDLKDIIYIENLLEDNFKENAISINNLARLGLVELDHIRSLTNEKVYECYKKLSYYQQAMNALQNGQEQFSKVELDKSMFVTTPYGDLFKAICLCDDNL